MDIYDSCVMSRVGTKKMTNMDFHEILPLDQFKSESKEFLGWFKFVIFLFTPFDNPQGCHDKNHPDESKQINIDAIIAGLLKW